MNKTPFWKADGFLAVVLVLIFLLAANADPIQSLERKAYDWGVRAASRQPSDRIAVIAIDDQSIANLGRWPWPRNIQAKLLDILAEGKAKVIGQTVLFFEPQKTPGLDYVLSIASALDRTKLAQTQPQQWQALQSLVQEAKQYLDNDQKMAESMAKLNNVLLGLYFELGEPQGNLKEPLPDYVVKNALTNVHGGKKAPSPVPARNVLVPIPLLGQQALAMGHLNATPDIDGAVRTEPLVIAYYDQYYPSLSLMLAAKSLNLEAKDIQVTLGEGVRLGNLKIATDPALRMNTYFYADRGGRPAFQVDSFYDVITGKIPPSKYQDKIVLIGATAVGVGSAQVTPISAGTPPVLTLAHSVSSILNQDFFVRPTWAGWVEWGAYFVIALYLILLLPRLRAGPAALTTALLFVTLLSMHFLLMKTQAIWLQLMLPTVLLLAGYLLLTTKRFLLTEKSKDKSEAESAESNRMLGLAFQGQGLLDMAFDKFRKVPMDDSLMDVLYNLGLDFERKRQFNKAEAVFRYMAEYNPNFRDLDQRIRLAKEMSQTIILGGNSGRSHSGMIMLGGEGVAKPRLGRYEIEKELGKGAMGVVYLGKDPKIGRIVAIKTMALSQEFEAEELEEAKARFFREAETAGRLNHPNIVTIYDAGEEHDLAYIAMEFLKGKNLEAYTKPDNLLPLPKVLSIVARVADALGYAHSLHVVHRDIKPANIMYDPENDTVKVTDFGFARITDASKTKTGTVIGTPSYMSPEQLSGAKIEGYSDLFSLGVSLYQLVCGQLPFTGDSMAQLMYKIANDPPPDISKIRPDLPPCLVDIINKALAKKPENRFESGAAMAQAIRQCAAALKAH